MSEHAVVHGLASIIEANECKCILNSVNEYLFKVALNWLL